MPNRRETTITNDLAELSIHGGKQSKCDLDAKLAKLKRKGITFQSVTA